MPRNNDINLERRVVIELLRVENKRGYVQIAVVDWVGEKSYRLLEKREFFNVDGGGAKMGKAKGFNRSEFALLLGKARLIADSLNQTPPPRENVEPSESSGILDASPTRDPWEDA